MQTLLILDHPVTMPPSLPVLPPAPIEVEPPPGKICLYQLYVRLVITLYVLLKLILYLLSRSRYGDPAC